MQQGTSRYLIGITLAPAALLLANCMASVFASIVDQSLSTGVCGQPSISTCTCRLMPELRQLISYSNMHFQEKLPSCGIRHRHFYIGSMQKPCTEVLTFQVSARRHSYSSSISVTRVSGAFRCLDRAVEALPDVKCEDARGFQETLGLTLRHVTSEEVTALIAELRNSVPESSIGAEAAPNVELLLSLGADADQITNMVRRNKALLGYDAGRKILPIVHVFHKFGIQQKSIVSCMAGSWRSCSLKAAQAESVLRYMRDELGVSDVTRVLVGTSSMLAIPVSTLRQKASFLRSIGIKNVGELLTKNSGCLNPSSANIAEKVAYLKELCDVDDLSHLMASDPTMLTSSIWTLKDSMEHFSARWGRETALRLVRKHPQTLARLWKTKEKKLDYVEKVMGRSFDELLRCPNVLKYSLEERIAPRYELLQSIGEDNAALNTFLPINDKAFRKRYILRES